MKQAHYSSHFAGEESESQLTQIRYGHTAGKLQIPNAKVGLKLNIQKTKIMASSPITSWEIDGKQWKQCQTLFLGLQNHCRW